MSRITGRIEMTISENRYSLLKLYIRNLSLESPLTGRMPSQVVCPVIDIDIDPEINRITDTQYEVAARFTVSARMGDTTMFLLELTQAGFFSMLLPGEKEREKLLRRIFPQVIFPAARNNIVSLTVTAGYQPIILDHIVLEDMFQNVPVTDKRVPVLAPQRIVLPPQLFMPPPPPQQEAVPPVRQAEPPVEVSANSAVQACAPRFGRGARVAMVMGGGVVAVALLVWWMANQNPPEQVPARTVQATAVTKTLPPPVAVDAASGRDVAYAALAQDWERTGGDWLVSQDSNDFTVELLRTADPGKVADLPPMENGQPIFLLRLPGAGNAGYVVLSGVYREERQARQMAQGSATWRVARFGDYRNAGE